MASPLNLVFLLASLFSFTSNTNLHCISYSIVPRQHEATTCGFAVVSGVVQFAAPALPAARRDETALIEACAQRDTEGRFEPASMLDLLKIFQLFGVAAFPIQGSFEDAIAMLMQGIPLVVHLKQPTEHFVLAAQLVQNYIAVADPAAGFAMLSRADFSASASGSYIALPDLRTNAEFSARASEAYIRAVRQNGFFRQVAGASGREIVPNLVSQSTANRTARSLPKNSVSFSAALSGSDEQNVPEGELSVRLDGQLSPRLSYGALAALSPGDRYKVAASLAFKLNAATQGTHDSSSDQLKKMSYFKVSSVLEARTGNSADNRLELKAEPFIGIATASVAGASLLSMELSLGTVLDSRGIAVPFFQIESGIILALSADLAVQAGMNTRLARVTDSANRTMAVYSSCEVGIDIPADRMVAKAPGIFYSGVRINLTHTQEAAPAIIMRWEL